MNKHIEPRTLIIIGIGMIVIGWIINSPIGTLVLFGGVIFLLSGIAGKVRKPKP